MSMITRPQWMYARKVNNYIEDATDNAATNAKFTSTTAQEYTVPAGKRWFVLGGYVKRDASSTLAVVAYDVSDKIIMYFDYQAAATGQTAWPCQDAHDRAVNPSYPIILDAGEYVGISFGSAQGAGAEASCIILEIDI